MNINTLTLTLALVDADRNEASTSRRGSASSEKSKLFTSWKCEICEKYYSSAVSLRKHHTHCHEEKPDCEYCGVAVRKDNMARHWKKSCKKFLFEREFDNLSLSASPHSNTSSRAASTSSSPNLNSITTLPVTINLRHQVKQNTASLINKRPIQPKRLSNLKNSPDYELYRSIEDFGFVSSNIEHPPRSLSNTPFEPPSNTDNELLWYFCSIVNSL